MRASGHRSAVTHRVRDCWDGAGLSRGRERPASLPGLVGIDGIVGRGLW